MTSFMVSMRKRRFGHSSIKGARKRRLQEPRNLQILCLSLIIIVLIPTLCFSLTSPHHKNSMQIADAYKSKNKHTSLHVHCRERCILLTHNGKVVNAEGRPIK